MRLGSSRVALWASRPSLNLDGVFPEYAEKDPSADVALLASELDDGRRTRAENDEDAIAEVRKMISKNWIKKFSSKFAAKRFLKAKVVLSELIVITKIRRKKEKGKIISKTKSIIRKWKISR